MSDILERILETKREEIAELKRGPAEAEFDALIEAQDAPRGFAAALRHIADQGKPAVIAEIKKASPSRGIIRNDFDPAWIAGEYESGGAACMSVLTDEEFFQGSPRHLSSARKAAGLPAIRKDFIIDEIQVRQARAMGADCILLIAAALRPQRLVDLYRAAVALDMDVLIEVHDRAELNAVVNTPLGNDPLLLGINNRSLRSFETRLETTTGLLPWIPAGHEVVTESGIGSAKDIRMMMDEGVSRFLIGESLMRQPNPGVALKRLLSN